MFDWFRDHAWQVGLGSAAMLVAGLLLTPVIVRRLRADYFVRPEPVSAHPVLWLARNLLGLILVVAGIAMLVLPGQGILTILLGLAVAIFPGKRKLELWIVRNTPVLRAFQRMRQKAGKEPLRLPEDGKP